MEAKKRTTKEIKGLKFGRNGVISKSFATILETQSAKKQIKALREVKLKRVRDEHEAVSAQ
jgi:hypothetical protein